MNLMRRCNWVPGSSGTIAVVMVVIVVLVVAVVVALCPGASYSVKLLSAVQKGESRQITDKSLLHQEAVHIDGQDSSGSLAERYKSGSAAMILIRTRRLNERPVNSAFAVYMGG